MRLVTARRWNARNSDLAHAHQHIRKLSAQLAYSLHQLSRVEADTDRAEEYAGRLEAEARELVEEVQHAEQARAHAHAERDAARAAPTTVFILFRFGEVHSVHPSVEAAEREAERHGASPQGWAPCSADRFTPDLPWRITRVGVHRSVNTVHDTTPGVHGDSPGVHDVPAGVHGGGGGRG